MTFRRKLLAVFALTVFLSVATVSWLVSTLSRTAFERADNERTSALVTQFRHEFNRQGEEVSRRAEAIAASEPVTRMGLAMNHTAPESATYFDLAKSTAETYQLDFLEFVDSQGTIISSAHWPAKFGYPEPAFASLSSMDEKGPFLKQAELQDNAALGLFAVRAIHVGEHPVYIVGGRRVDKDFLSALDLPAGMRVLLYLNHGDHSVSESLIDPSRSAKTPERNRPADKIAPVIEAVRQSNQEMTTIVHWSPDRADDELFHAIPLQGPSSETQKPLLGILLVGNSRRSYVELERRIRTTALLVGGSGILLTILLSSWVAARVTRPVEQLARAAQEVAAGNWNARVEVPGDDELAELAESFNHMTRELLIQKDRLIGAERVAAWRELARRLAHELKNPLFPLQLTVENLVRARQHGSEQFEEIFRESAATLLAEISNLKTIVSRFSEFSRMPQPQLQLVQMNDVIRGVLQLFQAQLEAPGRGQLTCHLQLDPRLEPITADPELLHRAISNLVLNAMEAMPGGGRLGLRTRNEKDKDNICVEVSDTGAGLTAEECGRIFTPYYTSKEHGTGLGLAIVQSIVSDHGGTVRVDSEPGHGTTFVIELPRNPNTLQEGSQKKRAETISSIAGE
jgi:signal transduction histidine kinase